MEFFYYKTAQLYLLTQRMLYSVLCVPITMKPQFLRKRNDQNLVKRKKLYRPLTTKDIGPKTTFPNIT